LQWLPVPIFSSTSYKVLSIVLSRLGAQILPSIMKKIAKGDYNMISQNHQKASYANKIEKKEARINWNNSAQEIDCQIRGLYGYMDVYFKHQDKKIAIIEAQIEKNTQIFAFNQKNVGMVLDEELSILCRSGVLKPKIVKKEGKKAIPIEEFLKGNKIRKGDVVS